MSNDSPKMIPPSPFGRFRIAIDRKSRFTLTAQVVESLRQMIEGGVLKPGDRLPPHLKIARQLGVSSRVVRSAETELSKLGLVEVRPRIGSRVMVPAKDGKSGMILFVVSEVMAANFWTGEFIREFRRRLRAIGCGCADVYVRDAAEGPSAYREFDEALRRPHAAVLVFHEDAYVMERLGDSEIPFAVLGAHEYSYGSYRGLLKFNVSAAVPDFVRHCIRDQVKSVVQVGFGDSIDAVPALRRAGVAAERFRIDPRKGCNIREGLGLAALERMFRRYGDRSEKLPDVFFFTDDCLAVGALSALNRLGVKSPEDVGVVVFQVVGNRLVYQRELTRIELDPKRDAALAVRAMKLVLQGRRVPSGMEVSSRYAVAETFPKRKKANRKRI